MAVIISALKRLLPGGSAWRLTGNADATVQGVAESIETSRSFIAQASFESIPATASVTLEEWHEALGLEWDQGQTEEQKRARVVASYTATGGASLEYIQGLVSMVYPQVQIVELPEALPPDYGFSFEVRGAVNTQAEFNRLQGMIQRIAPLHLEPNYDVRILANESTAYTGVAMTGRAITGRIA